MLAFAAGLLLLTATARAAGPSVYQPMGAPADPKVHARWNRYHDHAEATELLKAMAAAHPQRAKLRSLGKSYGGREMWLLTVTNFASGEDRGKPAFWIDGGIHANEIQGTEVALYTAWYLLEMYGRNDFVTKLVDDRAFYIVPMMSPDSRDAHFYEPNSTHSPRSGQRPVDDDRDGLVDEDGPDDLDGDGNVTQMRVRDPNGRYKPHPKYPQLMVQAEPDEPGEYRLLGPEGIDNDGDGRVNEDGDGYYDPNRDWPWLWQPGHVQRGAGRYPLAVDENRMVAEFVLDHPNIAGAQNYHNTGGMILRGPSAPGDEYQAADTALLSFIAKRGERLLPGYRSLVLRKDLYEVYGGAVDWFYQMRGALSFTNELFTPYNYFRDEQPAEDWFGRADEQEEFNRYLLFGQATVPWHEVNHPQFGKIEVGGWKKQFRRQPPSFLLEEECHRNMAFTLYHADQMPQIEVQSVRVEPAGHLLQVTAVVANRRLIPTHAAVDLARNLTPPDLVSIRGKDLKVVAGFWSTDPFFEKSTDQKRRPEEMRVPNVPGMGAVYVRWVVEGKGRFTVTARSVKGGTSRRDGELDAAK